MRARKPREPLYHDDYPTRFFKTEPPERRYDNSRDDVLLYPNPNGRMSNLISPNRLAILNEDTAYKVAVLLHQVAERGETPEQRYAAAQWAKVFGGGRPPQSSRLAPSRLTILDDVSAHTVARLLRQVAERGDTSGLRHCAEQWARIFAP